MRWRLAIYGVLLTLVMTSRAAAQIPPPPPCPDDTQQEFRGALPFSGTFGWDINLAPCQVLTVTITVIPSQTRYSTLAIAEAFNNTGRSLYKEQQLGTGTLTLMLPPRVEPWIPRGRPEYYGVRGDPGLPARATLRNYMSDPVSYIIQMTKTRRHPVDDPDPDRVYNEGGTGFADAPLVPLDTHYYGALSILEVPYAVTNPAGGQYFKIRLEPNESVVFTADLLGEGGLYSPGVDLYVWDPAYPDPVRWWYWVVSCGVPTGETCRKSVDTATQPFVNPYTTTTEFFVSIRSRWEYLDEFRLGLYRNTQQLTLFLDADNNFDPASPKSDIDRYVPCATLEGPSLPLGDCPQIVKVIAAYTVGNGESIITPPTTAAVRFELQQTSAFKGVAMNYGSGTEPDFALPGDADFIDVAWLPDRTSRFDLTSRDYGGFTTVHATHNANPADMPVPKDDDGDLLPDGGWWSWADNARIGEVWAPCGTPSECDVDYLPSVSGPPSNGLIGDGLANFEEYRGFVVRGGHRRTNPIHKDVFASSTVNVGIFYGYPALPTATHKIRDALDPEGAEYEPDTRIVNANHTNSGLGGSAPGHADQRALRVLQATGIGGYYGCTFLISAVNCNDPWNIPSDPNEVDRLDIYVERIAQDAAAYSYTPEQTDFAKRFVVGHEMGHGVHMCHRGEPCPDGAAVGSGPSLMDTGFLYAPQPTDSRAQYDGMDKPQIRIHVRF